MVAAVDQLLQLLGSVGAAGGQRAIALDLAGGEGCTRAGAGQLGAGLGDGLLLLGQLGRGGGDVGLAGVDGRLGLLGPGLIAARIDAHQRLAGGDLLIVGHQHLGDIALHLGGHHHLVGAQIGVVGALHEAPDGPPVEQTDARRQQDDQTADQQHGAHRATPAGRLGLPPAVERCGLA